MTHRLTRTPAREITVTVRQNEDHDDPCDPILDATTLHVLRHLTTAPVWRLTWQRDFLDCCRGHHLRVRVLPQRPQRSRRRGTQCTSSMKWCLHGTMPSAMVRLLGGPSAIPRAPRAMAAQDVSMARAIKQPWERRWIRRACDRTCLAMREMLARSPRCDDLAALLDVGLRMLYRRQLRETTDVPSIAAEQLRAMQPTFMAYTTILTLGGHGAHRQHNGIERVHPVFENARLDRPPAASSLAPPPPLLLLDMGARVRGYCADITRTFCLGTPTHAQRAQYHAVLALYTLGESMVRPGAWYRDIDRAVRHQLRHELQRLGVADYDDTYKYMPHGLGHSVGLAVHDTPCIYDVGPLQPGMVLTIEPGIYTPDMDIRIENTIEVTVDGCRVLSDGVPWDMAWFCREN